MIEQPKNPPAYRDTASLAPLEHIQRAENEIARQSAAARDHARQLEADAHVQAAQLLQDAQAQGQRDGQAAYDALIAQARLEADHLLDDAHQQAQALQRHSKTVMETALPHAIATITGMTQEAEAS